MAVSQSAILNNLTDPREIAAFKSMYSDMEDGKAVLNPEKLATFLREATIPNTILRDARLKLMSSTEAELNRTGINGRVLQEGSLNGALGTTKEDLTAADVEFGANTLNAKKLKALCEITDDEKEDNLEQAQFENTLLSMMGERIGEDLEALALFGDTTSSNILFKSFDGWIKKATNTITDGTDCDVTANTIEAMFDAMIAAVPPRHRNRNKLKFYVPFEVEDAYRNLLKARDTVLGDTTQTGFGGLAYKNIPITHAPTLDFEDCRAIDDTGKIVLSDPNNMVYGVYKQITVEPERIVKKELTQYYFRMRADVQYEYTNATVVGSIDETVLEGLPEASKE